MVKRFVEIGGGPMGLVRMVVVVLALALAVVACGDAASKIGNGGKALAKTTTTAAGSPGATLQAQFVSVVKKVRPAVVLIETSSGLGSGDIFDARGDIVTNHHVVGDSTTVKVTLSSGKSYQGKVLGSFQPDDLAVVRISAPNLKPLQFARSSKLQVGQIALAIGNPLGLTSTVTEGIVSALNRPVTEGQGTNAAIAQAIQTSAAINPGNSGGALVDLSGRLIGIPTLAVSDPQLGGPAAGIGFAIPSDEVRDVANQIVKYGKVVKSNRAYMGVNVADTTGGQGVYVADVLPNTPAAKAGVAVGQVITSIAGKPTPTTTALNTVLLGLKPGQTVKVTLLDPTTGAKKTVSLTLGSLTGS
ncbi:MAG TPA: trypsin-like peptidase domain-containing protein [Gaiellaceae bacterium]